MSTKSTQGKSTKPMVSFANVQTDAIPDSPGLSTRPQPQPKRHVNGQRVPDGFAHVVPYELTDEGINERRKAANGKFATGATVTRGPLDAAIEQRRDFRRDEMEPWEANDPMGDLAKAHVGAGMRPAFLSPDVIAKQGMRGYVAVPGKNGDPVTLGNMILAQMPEEKAQRRQEHYEGIGRAALTDMQGKFVEEQEKISRVAGRRPGSTTSSPEDGGLREVRGNTAEADPVLR